MGRPRAKPAPRKGRLEGDRRLFLFLGIYVLLSVLLFDPKLSVGGDNAIYLILGHSLVQGTGYRSVYLPEQPEQTQYPPGFPVLLSFLERITGSISSMVDKVFVLLTGVLATFISYRVCEHVFQKRSWIAMAFIVSVPMLILYNHDTLTEIPFLAVSMAAVYFLLKAGPERPVFYWAGFLCAVAGFLLRTAGIALVFGIVLFLILKKQYLYLAAFLVLFMVVFVPWQLRNSRVGAGQSYFGQFLAKNPYIPDFGRAGVKDFALRIGQNFVKYFFAVIPQRMAALFKPGWPTVGVGVVISGLMVLGFVLSVRAWTIIETYFIFAVAALFTWPALWAGERFLLPLVPIIVIYVLTALLWLQRKVKWRYLALAVTGVLVAINTVALGLDARAAVGENLRYLKGDRYAGYTLDWRRYFECIEWIKQNIPKDKVILARKPEFVYLLSGHRSFCSPFTGDRAAVMATVEKCDYILFDSFYWTNLLHVFLAPALKEDENRFRWVYKTEKPVFYVLRVYKGSDIPAPETDTVPQGQTPNPAP